MAQSRITAKNTFGEGLIMDFAPDNTLAKTLTNALNATLLTYNGNEMSLLNDMGNGRVETAFLPEGYIPMGACEFGGIIYVVSYNPEIDKCQIGSFPSPERNITKDDKLDTDLSTPIINASYFLNGSGTGENFVPNGTLNALISKVIIKEDSLNPGDKYIIEASNRSTYTNNDIACLSDLANDDKARRLKLSIVSIEDSGKITKLTTLDYEVNTDAGTKYYNIPAKGKIGTSEDNDIDSYRKLVSQNYNVFSSKIPGKLAILAELEVISSFSCGHRVITSTLKIDGVEYTTYDMYIDYKWLSEDATICPKYITLTKFDWSSVLKNNSPNYGTYSGNNLLLNYNINYGEQETTYGSINNFTIKVNLPGLVDSDTNNSYFAHEVSSDNHKIDFSKYSYVGCAYLDHTRYYSFNVGDSQNNTTLVSVNAGTQISELEINNDLGLSNTVYVCSITVPSKFYNYIFRLPFKLSYEVTPAMDFGLLDHLAVNNEIDFSLIGTKLILPSGFKYFISSDMATISINSEIYEEENHKVTNMIMEFYDINGFCGSYFFDNRESYSGNMVTNIPLNSLYLKKYKYGGDQQNPWYHNVYDNFKNTKAYPTNNSDTGDCGIIYSNMLYGIKLKYIYSELDPITQNVDTKTTPECVAKDYWIYTNGQFNNYYYTTDDFSQIKFLLPLIYSYKMLDNTYKLDIQFEKDSDKFLDNLLNATASKILEYNYDKKSITTLVHYKGTIDLDILIGLESNQIYNLLELSDDLKSSLNITAPSIELKLISPYDESKTFAIILESNDSDDSDNSDDSSDDTSDTLILETSDEYTKYNKSAYLKFKTSNSGNIDSLYTFHAILDMDIPELLFVTVPTQYEIKTIAATLLTPILYKTEKNGDYNYEEVGGESEFNRALCYVGSDDANSDDPTKVSDDSWYETHINSSGRSSDNLLYEYDSSKVHTDIVGGHEELVQYYNSLGNRQPFTLFTLQKPEPDSSSPCGYSTKWTYNIKGTGSVYAYYDGDENSDKYRYVTDSSGISYVFKLADNFASEYAPNYLNRNYIPAFITSRIAEGGYEVAMSSSGGNSTKLSDLDSLPYSGHTITDIASKFYSQYITTLKELITVNPDIKTCELGTFEYNEDNCKNLLLISVIASKITNGDSFKYLAKKLIAIHGVPFTTYVQYLLDKMYEDESSPDEDRKAMQLTEDDNNVNMEFDISKLGDNLDSAVTYINYTMLHEHNIINDYLDYENLGLVKYRNYYLNSDKEEWSEDLFRAGVSIDDTCFYAVTKDSDSEKFNLQKVTNSFMSDSKGRLFNSNVTYRSSKSSLKYLNTGAIFWNTSMNISDFIWDINNSKHHFIFNKISNLNIVDPTYSYQLDDDYGEGGDNKFVRSYYIGPSFNHKFS